MPGMSDNFDVTQTTQVLPLPDLPALNNRWTAPQGDSHLRRAQRPYFNRGSLPRVQTFGRELLAWERNLERYGIPGLRTTRYQIYRDDERRAGRVFERFGNQPGSSSMSNTQGN